VTSEVSAPYSLLKRMQNVLGAGVHLLFVGLLLQGLTLVLQRWISFPIPLSSETKLLLTLPRVGACLFGAMWFNRSLDLIRVHLLNGEHELDSHGPLTYVRHPLYSTLLLTLPPLVVVWLSDLLFIAPWALILVVSHYVIRLEERGLTQVFGQEYERYRRYVPALVLYKGAAGRRYREERDASEP